MVNVLLYEDYQTQDGDFFESGLVDVSDDVAQEMVNEARVGDMPTGLTEDIIGICEEEDKNYDVDSCVTGAVEALSLAFHPDDLGENSGAVTELEYYRDIVLRGDRTIWE